MKAWLFAVVFLSCCFSGLSDDAATTVTNNTAILVKQGRELYEFGKYSEARAVLTESLQLDPQNKAASYYLDLIKKAEYKQQSATKSDGDLLHPTNPPKSASTGEWLADKPLNITRQPALYSKQFHLNPKTVAEKLRLVPDGNSEVVMSVSRRKSLIGDTPEAHARKIVTDDRTASEEGLTFTTRNRSVERHEQIRKWISNLGVDMLVPGKSVFFNDRTGLFLVRASQRDLDVIEKALLPFAP
jgi:hypothetical protein